MKEVIYGPGSVRIELDSSQVVPDDPGAGTPAMVFAPQGSGTYWCVLDTGEVDDSTLTPEQYKWISSKEDYVTEFYEEAYRMIEES